MRSLMVLITMAVSRTETGPRTGTWTNGLYVLCAIFPTAPGSGPGPCTGIRHSRCDFTIILSKVLNSGLINSKRRSHARPSPPFRPPPTHHMQLYNAVVVTRCACQRCASSYRDSRECRLSSYR